MWFCPNFRKSDDSTLILDFYLNNSFHKGKFIQIYWFWIIKQEKIEMHSICINKIIAWKSIQPMAERQIRYMLIVLTIVFVHYFSFFFQIFIGVPLYNLFISFHYFITFCRSVPSKLLTFYLSNFYKCTGYNRKIARDFDVFNYIYFIDGYAYYPIALFRLKNIDIKKARKKKI